MDFSSDNAAVAAPEILNALKAANIGTAPSYGSDAWTERLRKAFCDLFEREIGVYPVFTGTAANSLALACATPPWGGIFCHPEAHINVDECGAPEMFSGGAKLLPVAGDGAKIPPAALAAAQSRYFDSGVHSVQPASVSITQATELGTVYTLGEVAAISDVAKAHKLHLHMDGARFANAIATLGCSPAEATWKAGVDLLSFGATKNGALAAEAIVVFSRDLGKDLEFRRKRSGHLSSKMRFVSAQLLAYLENGLWLTLARRANANAKRLADGMARLGVKPAYPVEANEVFVRLPVAVIDALHAKGAQFYVWSQTPEGGQSLVRLVSSFATPERDIEEFLVVLKQLLGK